VRASCAAEETRKKERGIGWLREAEGKGAAAARGRPPFLLRARATLPVVRFLPPWKWSQGTRRNGGETVGDWTMNWEPRGQGGRLVVRITHVVGVFWGNFVFSPYLNFFVYKMFADGNKRLVTSKRLLLS
jgi:hypothetical protein